MKPSRAYVVFVLLLTMFSLSAALTIAWFDGPRPPIRPLLKAQTPSPAPAARPSAISTTPSPPRTPTASPATIGDPALGEALFSALPCAGCHGFSAQGQVGPALAGTSLSFEQVRRQVRSPRDKMPRFAPEVVSDEDLLHIYAWLITQPRPTSTPSSLSPAQATAQALDGFHPQMNAADIRSRMEHLDELAFRIEGEVESLLEKGRFSRVVVRVGEVEDAIRVLVLFDTALAHRRFPARVGRRVLIYGVGANPAEVAGPSGSIQRLPQMQALEIRVK